MTPELEAFLLSKLNLIIQDVHFRRTYSNYYDGNQALVNSLAELGYMAVREWVDDEWAVVTREGYLYLRARLSPDERAILDPVFKVKP